MDENEFRQLIDLFPVVRSPDYVHAESDISKQSSRSAPSREVKDWQDAWSTEDNNEAFWGKLKLAAEQKVGAADAERFCKAFQQVYKKLVYEELTTDDARRIISSRAS
ncbi:octanoyltransferase [Perilla frutescens var. hirtella]|uniref:Octanoyltransferase n=1 Tax=Perilla frutescens var. hirtella TaxID=608512 RepID=A0AAD4JNA6_PERFH|nr:octanoyltransferase [Perilla frutescens var. hirtella]KAH6810755.1 octanoyltransferase [Perilla frutescens var. frutescens]KAH6837002.1 octanoyltransferase [Perilla frutescens var. hirtella]